MILSPPFILSERLIVLPDARGVGRLSLASALPWSNTNTTSPSPFNGSDYYYNDDSNEDRTGHNGVNDEENAYNYDDDEGDKDDNEEENAGNDRKKNTGFLVSVGGAVAIVTTFPAGEEWSS